MGGDQCQKSVFCNSAHVSVLCYSLSEIGCMSSVRGGMSSVRGGMCSVRGGICSVRGHMCSVRGHMCLFCERGYVFCKGRVLWYVHVYMTVHTLSTSHLCTTAILAGRCLWHINSPLGALYKGFMSHKTISNVMSYMLQCNDSHVM